MLYEETAVVGLESDISRWDGFQRLRPCFHLLNSSEHSSHYICHMHYHQYNLHFSHIVSAFMYFE